MKTRTIFIALAVVIILIVIASVIKPAGTGARITNFEQCAAAGNAVMESYPRQCRANDQTFVEEIVVPPSDTAAFNTPVILELHKTVVFPDGLQVRLFKIEDSRCKPDVQCIWAGELKGILHLTIDGVSLSSEFYLSEQTQRTLSVNKYIFTLQDATESSIRFTVVPQ